MILYIDETENEKYFIVSGILFKSQKDCLKIYKKFKEKVNNYPISKNQKAKIYVEFKSTLLDNKYQRIKMRMLRSISNSKNSVIYSFYIKKEPKLKQELKERIYIKLLVDIVQNINQDFDIIYDQFKKKDFEDKIESSLIQIEHVKSIHKADSQLEPGLQFADNICSVIKAYIVNEDKNNYYSLIKNLIIKKEEL